MGVAPSSSALTIRRADVTRERAIGSGSFGFIAGVSGCHLNGRADSALSATIDAREQLGENVPPWAM